MVEIPDDVATLIASYLRRTAEPGRSMHTPDVDAWADLLDPKPSTLREQVVHEFRKFDIHWDDDAADVIADAVLTVVADWLAAQPMPYPDVVTRGQRDYDVRLLRGES